ncbi:hypothetical protein DFH06DRAFT_1297288 [Mycena polygramma]|nr:hypothetical protein DFH06DRAFT_1297288 [Mycena polygramma]
MPAMQPGPARSPGGIADAIQPNLPPELERHIFELAALSRPVLIPSMMRVAWRVKQWTEPLLYRTLAFGVKIDGLPIFRPEIFTQIAGTKPHLLASVRNVMALWVPKTTKDIIRACPRIENLVLMSAHYRSSGHLPPPGFDKLSLKRLHCSLDALYDPSLLTTLAFAPLLHLTHLELFTDLYSDSLPEDLTPWTMLGTLSSLTHLALNDHSHGNQLPVCLHLLAICGCLSTLILLDPSHYEGYAELDLLCTDPRFVMMSRISWTNDWLQGILRGVDYWARADLFIAKRLAGEIERSTFFLEDTG